jgi:hypothetical protein
MPVTVPSGTPPEDRSLGVPECASGDGSGEPWGGGTIVGDERSVGLGAGRWEPALPADAGASDVSALVAGATSGGCGVTGASGATVGRDVGAGVGIAVARGVAGAAGGAGGGTFGGDADSSSTKVQPSTLPWAGRVQAAPTGL